MANCDGEVAYGREIMHGAVRDPKLLAERSVKVAAEIKGPDQVTLWRKMAARRQAGATLKRVADEFGTNIQAVRCVERAVARYDKGLEMLAKEPTSIEGLSLTGRLSGFDSKRHTLERFDVKTLNDLVGQKWARAELLYLSGFGTKTVDTLQNAMAEFGLSLHPDRPEPIRHKEKTREQGRARYASGSDWNDRDFVIEQCRRVKDHLETAYEFVTGNLDDRAYFDALRRLLLYVPQYVNPLSQQAQRLREQWRRDDKFRKLSKLDVEIAEQESRIAIDDVPANVVPFVRPKRVRSSTL